MKHFSLLIFCALMSLGINAQDNLRAVKSQTWYGDAMASVGEDVATKQVEFLYGSDNRLERRIQTGLLEDESWVLTNYYCNNYNNYGQLETTYSLQYGLYDANNYAFKAANDTVDYEYNENGQLAKEYTRSTKSYNLYEYDEAGNIVKKDIYKNGKHSQTLTYSDFTTGGPQKVKAESAQSYNCFDGEMAYDGFGNKISERHYTTAGVLNYAEYWTADENGFITLYEKKGISGGNEVDATRVEYTKVDADNVQAKTYTYNNGSWYFKGGSTCQTAYGDFNAQQYAPTLSAANVDNSVSEVTLTFSAPATAVDGYIVYRNGIAVGTLESGASSFTDKNVPNGHNEYFVQSIVGGSNKNISNVMAADVERVLPRAKNLHATTAYKNSNGSYVVTLAWDNPQLDEATHFVSSNVMKIGTYGVSPLLDEEEIITDPTTSTVDVNFGIDPVFRIYLRTQYAEGSAVSETITVDATTLLGKVSEENMRLRVVETYGDAMGNDPGMTKKEINFYGTDNRIQRSAVYSKTLGADANDRSAWTINSITRYIYGESGMLEKEYSQQYGRYDYGGMGFRAAQDTTFYEHNVEGQITKSSNKLGYTTYEYAADGSLTQKYSLEYATQNLEQTITYSDFVGRDKPQHTVSDGTLNSYKYFIDTEYDENGRKISEKTSKWSTLYNEYRASQLQQFVYDESGTLRSDTIFKITISNDIEKYTVNSVTTYDPEDGNPNRIAVVKKVWDNILHKFSNPKTWNVYEYTDINAEKYSPTLALGPEVDCFNTAIFTVTVPEEMQTPMTALNIYRNGIEIAHGVSYFNADNYSADEYGLNGKFYFRDEKVRNGEYDYFVELAQFDATMENEVQVNNISNILFYSYDTELPAVTNLREVSRRQTTTENTEEGTTELNVFVTLAWDEPSEDIKNSYGFKRYNVMLEGVQLPDNDEADGQANEYELALRGQEELKVYIMSVYDYGYAFSDTITVEEVPSQPAEKKGILYFDSPANYQVISISQNGEWACGVQYDESSDTSYGFRWNLLTGKMEDLGVCTASSISNDGTIAGSYYKGSTETAGIWKDGEWQALEKPSTAGAWASAITPDGQYVVGTDNRYKSYIWKDGKIENKIVINPVAENANGTFITYAISPDGQKAGGWAYYHGDNRNPGYWDAADKQFHDLEPNQPGSPWQAVKKFTADSKKALYWGGYHEEPAGSNHYGIHAIYDTETGDVTTIFPTQDDPFNFDLFDMNNDATVVVGFEQDAEGMERAIVWNNGQTQLAQDYLTARGATFDEDNILLMFRSCAVSGDANTFAVLYYDNNYNYHTMIVAFDRNISMTPPVNLEAIQISGIDAVALTWDEPLGDKETLKGYNVYRDGEKINSEAVAETQYYDRGLANGTYSYTVSALYEEGESAQSDASQATVSTKGIQAPTALETRQKGYNNVLAVWEAPNTNLTECNYYGEGNTAMDGFGGGEVSFETGTRFSADQMNLFDGYKLSAVSFFPKTEQGSWIINVYTHNNGKLTLIGTEKVSQELEYGTKNTVTLAHPISLMKDHDLVIGVQTNVTNESFDVQGIYENCLKVGYTDLVRMVGENDFYSINEAGGMAYDVTWATSALLTPAGVEGNLDEIAHYEVTIDEETFTTNEMSFVGKNLTDGNHTIGVAAVYTDGRQSQSTTSTVVIAANKNALKAIKPTVKAEDDQVTATWEAPIDDDATVMGYCADKKGSKSPSATESVTELKARVDYPVSELKTYLGYDITSLMFYPLSDATFYLDVYENDECVASAEPDNVTLDAWNTISIDPVKIQKNKIYRFVVSCYDCPAGEAPLAIDGVSPKVSYSSYLQAGGEDGWYTVKEETALTGSWLMRMNIRDAAGEEFSVDGYDIFIDNEKVADGQRSLVFTKNMTADDNVHTLRVDTRYTGVSTAVAGTTEHFSFITNGISDINADNVPSAIFNTLGQRVPQTYKGLTIQRGKKILSK